MSTLFKDKIKFSEQIRPWGIKKDGQISVFGKTRIEILKADNPLSIHVHPVGMDQIFIFTTPGELYIDLQSGIKLSDFVESAKRSVDISPMLNKVITQKDDVYNIPGGVVHCLLKGQVIEIISKHKNCKMCTICKSCLTYRIYDWERGRPLDLLKASKAMRLFSRRMNYH